MNKILKIGTRGSKLALWQAQKVQQLLDQRGFQSKIVIVNSEGDLDLITPLYAMGVEGVFTKTLDTWLLNYKIDIAVHSMKDVPTQLAKGIVPAAVLKRADANDIFIPNPNRPTTIDIQNADNQAQYHIATGSVRRKAQWLYHFPNTTFENLRGNVQTRLQKLAESQWDGIIMAKAGLERVNLLPKNYLPIPWMLPASAQGAIFIVCREENKLIQEQINPLNDEPTNLAVTIERDFLKTLMGGCSTPISALAKVQKNDILFEGNILSPDGKNKMTIKKQVPVKNAQNLGQLAAKELLQKGADKIVTLISKQSIGKNN